MDIYYRGFDANNQIASAAQHLSAAAARFLLSIILSVPYIPGTAWDRFKRAFDIKSVWSLCLVVAGWVIASVMGGLVGLAVNAVLIGYGLYALWDDVKTILLELKEWAVGAYLANTETELDAAARHFATAIGNGIIVRLELILAHRIFRAADRLLQRRFPVPEWLRKKYDEAMRKREAEIQKERRKLLEPVQRTTERVKETARKTAEVLKMDPRPAGMSKAADDYTVPLVIGGVVAVVGIGTVVGVALAGNKR